MIESLEEFKDYIINGDITLSVLEMISDSKCLFFNAKKIRHGLYQKYGIELRGRPSNHTDVCNDLRLKMILSSRIGHITRKLKRYGYIERFNSGTWKKIKEIDTSDPNLHANDS